MKLLVLSWNERHQYEYMVLKKTYIQMENPGTNIDRCAHMCYYRTLKINYYSKQYKVGRLGASVG